MTDGQLVAGVIGILAPMAMALLKKFGLSKKAQDAAILAALIAITGLLMLASGDINPKACADLGLEECFKVVYGYLGAVVGGAFVTYKMFFEALGIDAKIAGK